MSAKRNILAAVVALSLGTGAVSAQMMAGSDEDQAYAAQLWDAMVAANLAGDNMMRSFPYEGTDPHGMMLETFYTNATIGDHTGALIVKRNFGPEGVSADEVLADPGKHLGAVTVMYQREDGYDAETNNWFWVKYLPDGSLDKAPSGMALAGLVGKGADAGCIACHKGAGGDDYIFTTDAPMGMAMMK
jgi:hypothetical protein